MLLAGLAGATPAEASVKSNIAMGRIADDRTCVPPSPYAEALTTNSISRQAAHRHQALAAVPRAALRWWMEPVKSGRHLSKPWRTARESLDGWDATSPPGGWKRAQTAIKGRWSRFRRGRTAHLRGLLYLGAGGRSNRLRSTALPGSPHGLDFSVVMALPHANPVQ